VADVPVQAHAQELRQDVDAIEAAVDAVADGDIDKAILAGDGHGRLAAQHGERVEPRAAAAAENQTQNVVHDGSFGRLQPVVRTEGNVQKPFRLATATW